MTEAEMQLKIRALEYELSSCKDDYYYLQTIVEDKDELHAWLRMRQKTVSDVITGVVIPKAAELPWSKWWSLVMGAAAALEDAARCLRDPDAKKAAEGAAKHYRTEANALTPNVDVTGPRLRGSGGQQGSTSLEEK